MYNPLAKDQIGANVFGAATGYKAYQNGATPGQAINVGVHQRYWYKNLTASIVVFAIAAFLMVSALYSDEPTAYLFIGFALGQVAINVFVLGVTYVSLVDMSGFKPGRAMYRWFAPIQHRTPNVARFYWYLLILLPAWILMWTLILQGDVQGLWWFSDCENCTGVNSDPWIHQRGLGVQP